MCLKYFQGKQTTVGVVTEDSEPGEGAEAMLYGSQQTHCQRRDPHTPALLHFHTWLPHTVVTSCRGFN